VVRRDVPVLQVNIRDVVAKRHGEELHWYPRASKNQRHLDSIGNEVLGISTCPPWRLLHGLPSSASTALLPITRAGAAAQPVAEMATVASSGAVPPKAVKLTL